MFAVLNDPQHPDAGGGAEDEGQDGGNGNGLAGLREEIDEVGRSAERRFEPGRRGFGLACLAFALIIAQLLPWAGDAAGWQVLAGQDGAVPRLFAATSVGFGIVLTVLTLLTRRWWLAWVCAVGSCIATVDGLLAIWSLQSSAASGHPGQGPGLGMILSLVLVIVLAVNWLRLAGSRA